MWIGRRTSDAFTLAPRDDARPDPRRDRVHVLAAVPFSCVERAPPRRPRRLRRARHLPRSRCPRRQDGFLPLPPAASSWSAPRTRRSPWACSSSSTTSPTTSASLPAGMSLWSSPSPARRARSATTSSSRLPAARCTAGDQPIALRLLGSERLREALRGRRHGARRSLFLREVNIGIDPKLVFENADWALLNGAKPRGPGMERSDLRDERSDLRRAGQGSQRGGQAHVQSLRGG